MSYKEVRSIIDHLIVYSIEEWGTVLMDALMERKLGELLSEMFPFLPDHGKVKGEDRKWKDIIHWRFKNARRGNRASIYKHLKAKISKKALCTKGQQLLDQGILPDVVYLEDSEHAEDAEGEGEVTQGEQAPLLPSPAQVVLHQALDPPLVRGTPRALPGIELSDDANTGGREPEMLPDKQPQPADKPTRPQQAKKRPAQKQANKSPQGASKKNKGPQLSEYELQRQKTMAQNNKILLDLGLGSCMTGGKGKGPRHRPAPSPAPLLVGG